MSSGNGYARSGDGEVWRPLRFDPWGATLLEPEPAPEPASRSEILRARLMAELEVRPVAGALIEPPTTLKSSPAALAKFWEFSAFGFFLPELLTYEGGRDA